jgi:hypothetical protein
MLDASRQPYGLLFSAAVVAILTIFAEASDSFERSLVTWRDFPATVSDF